LKNLNGEICNEILYSINHRLSANDPVVSINADKKHVFMTHNIFYSTLCVSTVACAIDADLQLNEIRECIPCITVYWSL